MQLNKIDLINFWRRYLINNPTLQILIKSGAIFTTFPEIKKIHSFGSSIEALDVLMEAGYKEKGYLIKIQD